MKKSAFLFCFLVLLYNQNLMSGSILSSRGLGMDFEHPNTRAMGMGGFSLADIDPFTISKTNPASLFTHVMSRMSVYYFNQNNYYKDQLNGSAFSQYSNFDGFNFIVPLQANFGFALGLTPLTKMDYILSFENSIDSYTYTKSVKGNGGLNSFDFSWYCSYKHIISLGLTGRYIFGNLNTTWRVDYDNATFISTKDYSSTNIYGYNYKVGIILKPLSSLTLGAVYSPQVKLDNKTSITYTVTDSTHEYNGSVRYPGSYGIGISFIIQKIGLIGIDYLFTEWESLLINKQKPDYMNNVNKFSIGFESAASNDPPGTYFKQIRYRLGFCQQPYLALDPEENQILESWVSFGLGLPLKGRSAEINIAVNYGKRGSLDKNGLYENLLRISLSLSIGEKWFQRRY
ncbi:MAG: hypothetical protein P8078_09595 [bacterium]